MLQCPTLPGLLQNSGGVKPPIWWSQTLYYVESDLSFGGVKPLNDS